MQYSRSKKFAVCIFVAGFALATTCAFVGLEGACSASFSTATLASTALYANKQHQDRKKLEITNNTD